MSGNQVRMCGRFLNRWYLVPHCPAPTVVLEGSVPAGWLCDARFEVGTVAFHQQQRAFPHSDISTCHYRICAVTTVATPSCYTRLSRPSRCCRIRQHGDVAVLHNRWFGRPTKSKQLIIRSVTTQKAEKTPQFDYSSCGFALRRVPPLICAGAYSPPPKTDEVRGIDGPLVHPHNHPPHPAGSREMHGAVTGARDQI